MTEANAIDAPKPDFFLVGAPKCGTTAMDEYLKQHPEIFLPYRKELHYFGSDLAGEHFVRDLDTYLSFYRDADAKRIGESAVWYLMSTNAAAEIKAFCPDARIIIMLRNPVDVMYSLHNQMVYNGNEDIADFAEALAAQDDRKAGRRIPPAAMHVGALFYYDIVRYTEQVRRYFDAFGRERVHVIVFDDFKQDNAAACRQTFRFLGVDESFVPQMKVVNASKEPRIKALRLFFRKPPAWIKRLGRIIAPSPAVRTAIWTKLRLLNASSAPRTKMDPQLRERLTEYFADEVASLGELLGRDLSHWSAL